MFCFMHAIPSQYHHYSDFLTGIEHIESKILEYVNACCVYTVEIVSEM